MKAKTKTAQSTTITTTATIKYSPWLTLRFCGWYGGWPERRFCCENKLLEFFDLKPARKGWVTQIRFRVSPDRLGDDYEVRNKFASYSGVGLAIGLATAGTVECIQLYRTLSQLLYIGCWVGLESREVAKAPLTRARLANANC